VDVIKTKFIFYKKSLEHNINCIQGIFYDSKTKKVKAVAFTFGFIKL